MGRIGRTGIFISMTSPFSFLPSHRKNKKAPEALDFTGHSGEAFGVPEVIRTPDLPLRSMAYHVIHGSDVTSNIIPYAE